MQPAYNKGAISAMMINILLFVGIATAVTVLLLPTDPEQAASTPPTPSASSRNQTASAPPLQAEPAPAPRSQEEIDTLKAQLDAEARRLEAARKQEALIEKIRQEQAQQQVQASQTELETARVAPEDARSTDTPTQATSAKIITEIQADQSAATDDPPASGQRLITPMGFPE